MPDEPRCIRQRLSSASSRALHKHYRDHRLWEVRFFYQWGQNVTAKMLRQPVNEDLACRLGARYPAKCARAFAAGQAVVPHEARVEPAR